MWICHWQINTSHEDNRRDAAKDLHNMIFIDLEKAFNRIPRDMIWTASRSHGVPEKYVQIIMDMFRDVT